MNQTVLILNGPGLGDLSGYDSNFFGKMTLEGLSAECQALCDDLGIGLDFRQTDNRDEMFHWIAEDSEEFDGVIINPAGHSPAMIEMAESYRSAIKTIATHKKPIIEVHITNIYRHSEEATQPLHEPAGDMGFICGVGKRGYLLAIRAIAHKLKIPATV
jgi:3-dehydroquinate dehydratase-2